MRRFLVVGCGGSGGKTLAYLMDQLRSDLRQDGVEQLPPGWQFVFVDVPSAVDEGPDGVGSVVEQGGTYIGMGPRGGSYTDLDQAVSQRLTAARSLDCIGTWAPPRPDLVHTPINSGAGQSRAIGRMVLLARAGEVRRALEAAHGKLFTSDTETAMTEVGQATGSDFDARLPPIVFVVGSMAGGSGASMALDVCRLLTQVPGVTPQLISLFMVSADIFDSLPKGARTGVRANALAMLGEIVASQTGSARQHDVKLLKGLGQAAGEGAEIPFARVFPVGRSMGVQRALFGDGSMDAVYRGLARGLAGLMGSDVANRQFVEYDLTNAGFQPPDPKYLGWGAQRDSVPWGSYGFASLSMGRDRYAEYSAQRIARSCVDRLLRGHLQPGNPAAGSEQVNGLLDVQWEHTCRRLGLPLIAGGVAAGQELGRWLMSDALPRQDAEETAAKLVDRDLAANLPAPHGQQPAQWRALAEQVGAERRGLLADGVTQAAYQWTFVWTQELLDRVVSVVSEGISRMGLAYASGLVDRLSAYLADTIVTGTQVLSKTTPARDVAQLPDEVSRALSGMRGAIIGGDAILAKVLEAARSKLRTQLYARASGLLSEALRAFVVEALRPLGAALREAQALLDQAAAARVSRGGLAHLETTQYGAWPSDTDGNRVPSRFDEANNEVLLTTSREFPGHYERDLSTSVPMDVVEGVDPQTVVISQVIGGTWRDEGGTWRPRALVEMTTSWRSRALPTDPRTGESVVPTEARFNVHARPAELLDRSRAFVRRPQESFDRFCSVSLREYLNPSGLPESEIAGRRRDAVIRFRETLSMALPLASVDEQCVKMLHDNADVEYVYKFSSVPFGELEIVDELRDVLTQSPDIGGSSVDNFEQALTDRGNPRRIDVFGSYPLYSPLVFDSILEPIAQEWDATPPQGRRSYWTYRRARPLDAALPMSEAERRSMVAGWYIGQLVGEIQIPDPPYEDSARIWDPRASAWVSFPYPLLMPPERFRARYDWLPAVLESHLLAVAHAQQKPAMSSLQPYLLLRQLYDDQDLGPASGIVVVSAVTKLAVWLQRGATPGLTSRIPSVAAAGTSQERYDAGRAWLVGPDGPGDLAESHFLPPTAGASGGAFSLITSRQQAAATPYFRDLAPDVSWATRRLAACLDEAVKAGAQYVPEEGAPNPEFSLPPGEVF